MFIGRDLDRVDALAKVLGTAEFAHDLRMSGMLFACVVRSTRPHALLAGIDVSGALAVPGVLRVLSYKDIPGQNTFGALRKDQPFLASTRVRYTGEPILVVLGQNEAVARQGAARVKIDYSDIDAVPNPDASGEGRSLIRDTGNIFAYKKVRKGDVEKGFAESDVVTAHTFRTTWIDHAFLETEAGIGYVDAGGRIVIKSSTQNIHYKRAEISRLLAMPEERIRVIQATTGGGFGGKLDVTVEGFLALAVHALKRPVFMRYTREESFLSNTKRHPLSIEYKTGARKDGTLTAVKVHVTGDTGPYASYGDAVCLRAAVHATGPYEVANVWADSTLFITNSPISGAMRGFGVPQLAFAHESQIDEVADLLGIDPMDIRIKNGLKRGSITATGQVLSASVGFVETLKRLEPFWRARKKQKSGSGFGLGCMYYGIGNTGVANPAHALVELGAEGRVILHTGACEIGQGSDTVLLQILLETLGLSQADVLLDRGDTDTSKDAGSSSASRQTYVSGRAVQEAALGLRTVLDKAGYYRGRTLRDIYCAMKDGGRLLFDGLFNPPASGLDEATGQGVPYATYAFASHMTEVEVEESTGACRVKQVYAAHDVGKSINPKGIKGQVCGGVAMGIGLALMEEFIPGKTASFDTYYIPTSMDMPRVEVFLVEDGEPTGPFGAKGVGEPALIPQAASIANAIRDAAGVRVYELPCHMERLKGLMEDKKATKREEAEP
jgi:CO/xanthine dehydrogenase Mo-binding subunit